MLALYQQTVLIVSTICSSFVNITSINTIKLSHIAIKDNLRTSDSQNFFFDCFKT